MHATSELILNFVLNAGWQIAAIFAVAALGAWLLRNGPARYRHTLWIVALVASLIVPLLTATRFGPAWVSSVQVVAPQATSVHESAGFNEEFTVEHLVTRRAKTISTTTRTSTSFDVSILSWSCLSAE